MPITYLENICFERRALEYFFYSLLPPISFWEKSERVEALNFHVGGRPAVQRMAKTKKKNEERNRWTEKQTSCKAGKGVDVGAGAKIKC